MHNVEVELPVAVENEVIETTCDWLKLLVGDWNYLWVIELQVIE